MSHSTVLVIGPRLGDDATSFFTRVTDPGSVIAHLLAPFDEGKQVTPYREPEEIPPSYMLDECPTEEAYITHVRAYYARRWADYDAWVEAGKPDLHAPHPGLAGRSDSEASQAYDRERGIREIEERNSDPGRTDAVPPRDADNLTILRAYHDETLDHDEKGWFRMSTYNPDSRWDWYAVGGGWAGYFTLKDEVAAGGRGGPKLPHVHGNPFSAELDAREREHFAPKMTGRHTDQATKGMIDFEAMRSAAAAKAAVRHDLFLRAAGDTPPAEPWSAVLDRLCPEVGGKRDYARIDAARSLYHDQPRMLALKQFEDPTGNRPFSWIEADELEELQASRDAYIQQARDSAVPTFAYLHEGTWCERERMGWFGAKWAEPGAPTREEWLAHFNRMVEELPDDTLLTLVDVHI